MENKNNTILLSALLVGLCLVQPSTAATFLTTGALNTARDYHTTTLLPNGKILVAGGRTTGATSLATAELYDPATGTWTVTGPMHAARAQHTATLLPNGQVLVAAGYNNTTRLASAELYNPATGTWTMTGTLISARALHTASLFPMEKCWLQVARAPTAIV